MPVGDQNHRGVAVAVAISPGGSDQPVNLGVGQVLPRADLGVRPAARWTMGDCPINSGWRHQRQLRFCHGFSGLSVRYCPFNSLLRDSAQARKFKCRTLTAILHLTGPASRKKEGCGRRLDAPRGRTHLSPIRGSSQREKVRSAWAAAGIFFRRAGAAGADVTDRRRR